MVIVTWLAGHVKELTHLSQRVGQRVPNVVVWPCLTGWLTLMCLSPLARTVQKQLLCLCLYIRLPCKTTVSGDSNQSQETTV